MSGAERSKNLKLPHPTEVITHKAEVGTMRDRDFLEALAGGTVTEEGGTGSGYQYVPVEKEIRVVAMRTWELWPALDGDGEHIKKDGGR